MPLTVGDPTPWFIAPVEGIPQFSFASLAGRWVGLVFAPDGATAERIAQGIAAEPGLEESNVCLFGIAVAALGSVSLGPRWFFDPSGSLAERYGVTGVGWLILDPMLRVYEHGTLDDPAALVRRLARLGPAETHAGVELNAPVLILPRVFEPAFCEELVAIYRRQGGVESGFMREVNGKTVLINDPLHKQRKDVLLEDVSQQAAVQERIAQRLLPEIRKAFQYNATRIERYLVARYVAGAGWFGPHRDNTTQGTAHRKFAVTINLNAEDYEGGDLRFPEFGNRRYRAPTGGAAVFSCSLLHQALPVTRGERFACLPFLYDEAGAILRAQNAHLIETAGALPG